MPFAKGHVKIGGRKKGTPNKRTLDIAEELEKHNFDVIQKFSELYEQFNDPVEKRNMLYHIMEYLYPKRKAIEMDIGSIGESFDDEEDPEVQEIVSQLEEQGKL